MQCSAGRTSFNIQGQQRRNNVSEVVGTEGHDVWSSSPRLVAKPEPNLTSPVPREGKEPRIDVILFSKQTAGIVPLNSENFVSSSPVFVSRPWGFINRTTQTQAGVNQAASLNIQHRAQSLGKDKMGELMARQSHQLLPGAPERGNPARRATGTNMQASGLNRWSEAPGKAAPASKHVCLSQKPPMLPVPYLPGERQALCSLSTCLGPLSALLPPLEAFLKGPGLIGAAGSCSHVALAGAPPCETSCQWLQLFKHCPVLSQGYLCVAAGGYE